MLYIGMNKERKNKEEREMKKQNFSELSDKEKAKILFDSNQEVIIKNEHAAGKFAVGYKYTVMQGITQEDGGIIFHYARRNEYIRYGKNEYCTMTLSEGIGCIFSGYGKTPFRWYGEEEIVQAKYLAGKTYDFKEEIKSLGFFWNRELNRWEKKEV